MRHRESKQVPKSSRRAFLATSVGAAATLAGCATHPADTRPGPRQAGKDRDGAAPFSVLCYNIFVGGSGHARRLSETLNVIRSTEADIVLLQEARNTERWLAQQLGFDYFTISNSVAFLSRFPIVDAAYHGIEVAVPGQGPVWCFNVHLEAYPYGPYDLRDDPTLSEADLIRVARETRGQQIAPVLKQARVFMEADASVILAGDFNEPSHLDWTENAAAAGLHFGRAVQWPTSRATKAVGFSDLYRHFRPDEIADPGDTWTPTPELREVHDRIDRIYFSGTQLEALGVQIVGEQHPVTDRVVDPFPSDHRAVLGSFQVRRS